MAIRMAVAVSPGYIFIIGFSLWLQIVSAQQCLTSNGMKHSDGSQQSLPKSSGNLNQVNTGHNFNSQHSNMHQMNYQQPSNIQQGSFMQQAGSVQPQWNLQQVSQPNLNSISNVQQSQQQTQGAHTYPASQNMRLNQATNTAQPNAPQQANSQPLTSTFIPMASPTNKPQYGNQAVFAEAPQFQPTFTFHPVQSKSSSNNGAPLHTQQNDILQYLNPYSNTQNIDYNCQSQPVSNSVTNQRTPLVQNPIAVIVPSSTNSPQSQPIILAVQTPQMLPIQSSPLTASQFGVNQPIVYAVQTPPSASNQNQQIAPKQANKPRGDDQSLMTYVMSQIQNQMGNDNALASILPGLINTKSEKSSIKALLPLLFNILSERNNGCVCPHCGCNNNNNCNNQRDLVINSGYSNKKVYSPQEAADNDLMKINENNIKSSGNVADREKVNNNNVINDDAEFSDEEDDEEEDSEEYDEDE